MRYWSEGPGWVCVFWRVPCCCFKGTPKGGSPQKRHAWIRLRSGGLDPVNPGNPGAGQAGTLLQSRESNSGVQLCHSGISSGNGGLDFDSKMVGPTHLWGPW